MAKFGHRPSYIQSLLTPLKPFYHLVLVSDQAQFISALFANIPLFDFTTSRYIQPARNTRDTSNFPHMNIC